MDGIVEFAREQFLPSQAIQQDLITVTSYDKPTYIFSISDFQNPNRSNYLYNPIIILDDVYHVGENWRSNPLYTAPDIMYKIPESTFLNFLKEESLENELVKVTSAQDIYYYNCQGLERTIKLLSIISLFLIAIEGAITIFLIHLEYSIHGMELAVKRTLGYGVFSRAKYLFLLPMGMTLVCTLGAIIIEHSIHWGNQNITLLLGGLITGVEILVTVRQCLRFDHLKTQLILKGGPV